jgi:hypothetical protein
MFSESLEVSPWMITGGITDSDTVCENSVLLVSPELIVEALFDKVRLASTAEFLCDLALEFVVCCEFDSPEGYSLCAGSEPVCARMIFSELICTSELTGRDSLSNSSFIEGVKISGMAVVEDDIFPCLCTLEDSASVRFLLEVTEICCIEVELISFSSLHDDVVSCVCVLGSVLPVGVSLFASFESRRTSVHDVLGLLFICLVEVSELLLVCFLEDVVPFCTCALGVETLCTNFLEGVATLCDCLLAII